MPDPKVLRRLLARYADLRIVGRNDEASRRALDDVSYTLCVMTATGTIEDAIEAADDLLEGEVGARAGGHVSRDAASMPVPGVSTPSVPAAAAPPVDDGGVTLVA
ncbi:DUF5133 domain-containing protein [Streptomyces sp. NPDC059165]|uniref:DUF5133 domain-containing protein n=1 Tax=Streptomyces sp. NPDC059165 TaxID=3346751 RepID=UPI0036A506CA